MCIYKILSKKGQVSTEIAILIIATITVSTIAVYYYIINYLNSSPDTPRKAANNTIKTLDNLSQKYVNKILNP